MRPLPEPVIEIWQRLVGTRPEHLLVRRQKLTPCQCPWSFVEEISVGRKKLSLITPRAVGTFHCQKFPESTKETLLDCLYKFIQKKNKDSLKWETMRRRNDIVNLHFGWHACLESRLVRMSAFDDRRRLSGGYRFNEGVYWKRNDRNWSNILFVKLWRLTLLTVPKGGAGKNKSKPIGIRWTCLDLLGMQEDFWKRLRQTSRRLCGSWRWLWKEPGGGCSCRWPGWGGRAPPLSVSHFGGRSGLSNPGVGWIELRMRSSVASSISTSAMEFLRSGWQRQSL